MKIEKSEVKAGKATIHYKVCTQPLNLPSGSWQS
jgi:hypothetical protein